MAMAVWMLRRLPLYGLRTQMARGVATVNKSEIAEKARKFAKDWVWSHDTDRVDLLVEMLIAWERAIAESQAPK
jgi:hypothetical protein